MERKKVQNKENDRSILMKKLYQTKYIECFFLLLPIIDMLTSQMIQELNISFSIGTILKSAFLLYVLIYLAFLQNKKTSILLLSIFTYCTVFTITSMMGKNNFSLIETIESCLKIFYYPLVLLFFYEFYKKNKMVKWETLAFSGMIIGITYLISITLGTDYCSYRTCYNNGSKGWFYSANELSCMLLPILCVSIHVFMKNKNTWFGLGFIMVSFFLINMGTKVSYFGLLLIYFFYICYYLITFLAKKRKKTSIVKYLVLVTLFFLFTLGIRLFPIYITLKENYEEVHPKLEEPIIPNENDTQNETTIPEPSDNTEPEYQKDDLFLIFNGREEKQVFVMSLYQKAPLINQLFGLYTKDNYNNGEVYNQIIERDFHDILCFYGIIGFFLSMSVPIILLFKIATKILKYPSLLFDDSIVLSLLGIITLYGIAYLSGHVLLSPAVTIYLALLIANTWKVMEDK